MTDRDPVTRTEIIQCIKGAFGTRAVPREELIEHARRAGARPALVGLLQRLPNDRPYSHVRDLWYPLEDVPL